MRLWCAGEAVAAIASAVSLDGQNVRIGRFLRTKHEAWSAQPRTGDGNAGVRGLTGRRANGVKDPLLVFSPARPGRRWDVIYLRLLTLIFPPSTRKRPTLRSTMTRVAFPYGICAVLLLPS